MPNSPICQAASKAATKYLIDVKAFKARYGRDPVLVSEVGTTPARLQRAHSRCNGKPGIKGPNSFVCDCICHQPQGAAV